MGARIFLNISSAKEFPFKRGSKLLRAFFWCLERKGVAIHACLNLDTNFTVLLGACAMTTKFLDNNIFTFKILARPICRNVSEDFCCINFGGFSRGFSWRIFLGTFSHKNEEKKSGDKIREKIRRPKNKNPRKIRSAKNPP